jgi:hypothetical protein
MKPESIVQVIRIRLGKSKQLISAYWLKVESDRKKFSERIIATREDVPIFPFIIREHLFINPNTILNDLVTIMNNNRKFLEYDYRRMCIERNMNCALLLLGRNELCLAQASSPVTLPEWFPFIGGTTIETYIEDLTWSAAAPLNTEEMKIGEISTRLFLVEKILLNRLQSVHKRNHNAGNQLCEYFKRRNGGKLSDVVDIALKNLTSVANPIAFRPSVKDGRSLLALLWEIQSTLAPSELHKLSKALAAALEIQNDAEIGHESFFNTLCRPTNSEQIEIRIARNIIITTATACRLITIAAHADNYESYPLTLIGSVSNDINNTLSDIGTLFERISE